MLKNLEVLIQECCCDYIKVVLVQILFKICSNISKYLLVTYDKKKFFYRMNFNVFSNKAC